MGYDGTAGIAALGFYLAVADCPRGSITLRSASPYEPPASTSPTRPGSPATPSSPSVAISAACSQRRRSAAAAPATWTATCRSSTACGSASRSGHHGAGGCAIGAVVDPDLRVLGIDGLHVADASVFPAHVTNNPNVTVHMVGEVAAARISGRRPAA